MRCGNMPPLAAVPKQMPPNRASRIPFCMIVDNSTRLKPQCHALLTQSETQLGVFAACPPKGFIVAPNGIQQSLLNEHIPRRKMLPCTGRRSLHQKDPTCNIIATLPVVLRLKAKTPADHQMPLLIRMEQPCQPVRMGHTVGIEETTDLSPRIGKGRIKSQCGWSWLRGWEDADEFIITHQIVAILAYDNHFRRGS